MRDIQRRNLGLFKEQLYSKIIRYNSADGDIKGRYNLKFHLVRFYLKQALFFDF